MTARARLALGVAAALLFPHAARSQTPAEYLASGIRAYQDLELDAAAALLRRAADPEAGLVPDQRARALAYLGATEVFRGQRDSAQAAFRRLVRLDPRYRLDALIFPPEVTGVFEGARRAVRAVALTLPDSAVFRAGQPGLVLDAFASAFHDLRVEILRADGSAARTVYSGSVGDSLRVEWDGRATGDAPIPSGRYVLVVSSLDPAGRPARIVRVPLTVTLTLADTLPHPLPPADSLLLPERAPSRPALEALIGGLLVGVAVAVGPQVVASDAELSPARFAVGASVTIVGLSTFLARRPGRPLADAVAANERARAAWREELDRVSRQNEDLKRNAVIRVVLGPPQVIEREQP